MRPNSRLCAFFVAFVAVAVSGMPTGSQAALSPTFSETGKIAFSIDGLGTNDPAGGIIEVEKPAGATVRRAFFACASTGASGHVIADGEVTIDGAGVSWSSSVANSIGSSNSYADVTLLVKPTIDAAPAGRVGFLVVESSPFVIDGCALGVVMDDPSQTSDSTVIVEFGAQATAGDSFAITLAQPLDLVDPSSTADMGLAISFSAQDQTGVGGSHLCGVESNMDSQIDVNGTRLTSCAGNLDDGVGTVQNGMLFTVGGLDDANDNPADPFQRSADGGLPRVTDDELYDLKPFVTTGDTLIQVDTVNPSDDDNIFIAYFVTSVPAIVGEGIVLAPLTATNDLGQMHTVTATVVDTLGMPVQGRDVDFEIVAGPHVGLTGTDTTDVNGEATFTYTGTIAGIDAIVARFTDSMMTVQTSNQVTKEWLGPYCGDDTVDPPDEECDGTSDAACPGLCGIPGSGPGIECVCSACGCMDVALVVDDTGSMDGAITNVIAGLNSIISSAQTASGGDLRMSVVTFKDSVEVDQGLTNVIADVQTAVGALTASGGGGGPEASDQALRTVVTDTSGCGPTDEHGTFRDECVKVAVLVTDADPGGCDDTYTGGVDDVEADAVANLAAAAGIKIAAVQVGGGADASILQNYATVTGGAYVNVPGDGSGTSDVIEKIIANCGTPPSCGNDVVDPAYCSAGNVGVACAVDSDCDTVPAAGDGICLVEECDGADDSACPGRCRPMADPDGECTCRECGDGILDPGEACDPGMQSEVCSLGTGDEDNDGLLNCDDIENCPAICDTPVTCTVDADCPPSQNNGKWTFFPDSKCVNGMCWVYCAQDIFCRNNPSIPGSNHQSRCVAAQTCGGDCQYEAVCGKLGRDPALIRLRDGKPDFLKIHASFPVSEDTDPEATGFRFAIYNADGSVYETYMLPGDVVAKNSRKRSFKYKNKAARAGDQPVRNGVALLDLRKRERDGQTVMTLRLKAYGDLSSATKALMTTQAAVGGEGAALQSLWRKTSNGWSLKQSDLF